MLTAAVVFNRQLLRIWKLHGYEESLSGTSFKFESSRMYIKTGGREKQRTWFRDYDRFFKTSTTDPDLRILKASTWMSFSSREHITEAPMVWQAHRNLRRRKMVHDSIFQKKLSEGSRYKGKIAKQKTVFGSCIGAPYNLWKWPPVTIFFKRNLIFPLSVLCYDWSLSL